MTRLIELGDTNRKTVPTTTSRSPSRPLRATEILKVRSNLRETAMSSSAPTHNGVGKSARSVMSNRWFLDRRETGLSRAAFVRDLPSGGQRGPADGEDNRVVEGVPPMFDARAPHRVVAGASKGDKLGIEVQIETAA